MTNTLSRVEGAPAPVSVEQPNGQELRQNPINTVATQIMGRLAGDQYAQARLIYTGHPSYQHPSEHPHTVSHEPFGQAVEDRWNKLNAVGKFTEVADFLDRRIAANESVNPDLDGALAAFARYNASYAEYKKAQQEPAAAYAKELQKRGIGGTEATSLRSQYSAPDVAFPRKPSNQHITTFMNVLRSANE